MSVYSNRAQSQNAALRLRGTGSLIMGGATVGQSQESTQLQQMKSEHASSALLQSRQKPTVPRFSDKALFY